MGRTPCCDQKMRLKKGPWSPEEDQTLISYIRQHGHDNWRALPKHAGLLRCGKSCRLRWINYLKPDIKRGNFTHEEEETIIKLHELLGNRWSAIAARLPGRTDNEIKNVWHTHLKKRPNNHPAGSGSTSSTAINTDVVPTRKRAQKMKAATRVPKQEASNGASEFNEGAQPINIVKIIEPVSPQSCPTEVSTVTSSSTSTGTTSASENDNCSKENVGGNDTNQDQNDLGDFPEFNDEFWMEVLTLEDTAMSTDQELPSFLECNPSTPDEDDGDAMFGTMNTDVQSEDMDVFWDKLLNISHEFPEIAEIWKSDVQ